MREDLWQTWLRETTTVQKRSSVTRVHTTDRLLQDHALGEIVEELGAVALAVLLES